ncbi:hypothetical protein J2Y02_005425, partial [Neobacillus drentensis]|nr:hypothetical protein [Neobacillus drentensis]
EVNLTIEKLHPLLSDCVSNKSGAAHYGEFYFLYTNNDANSTVISARIL